MTHESWNGVVETKYGKTNITNHTSHFLPLLDLPHPFVISPPLLMFVNKHTYFVVATFLKSFDNFLPSKDRSLVRQCQHVIIMRKIQCLSTQLSQNIPRVKNRGGDAACHCASYSLTISSWDIVQLYAEYYPLRVSVVSYSVSNKA